MHFEKLNEANFRCHDIRNNDIVPVGGSYPGALNLAVIADLTQFEPFFSNGCGKSNFPASKPDNQSMAFPNLSRYGYHPFGTYVCLR